MRRALLAAILVALFGVGVSAAEWHVEYQRSGVVATLSGGSVESTAQDIVNQHAASNRPARHQPAVRDHAFFGPRGAKAPDEFAAVRA